MSASDIIKELPKLTEAERQLLIQKLQELAGQPENVRLQEESGSYGSVNLKDRGIDQVQAGDLRARLKTFSEDWNRPEACIYDEDPAR